MLLYYKFYYLKLFNSATNAELIRTFDFILLI